MTHSSYAAGTKGANPVGIRLSIGLESPTDILSDLKAALTTVSRPQSAPKRDGRARAER